MSNIRHGRAYIQVGGLGLLPTMPGAKLRLGGVERTPIMSGGRVVGYAEKDEPAVLTCSVSIGVGDSLAAIQRVLDATITYECDTGTTYMVAQAFCAKVLELQGSDGSTGNVQLEFVGNPAQEMFGSPAQTTRQADAF